jgi:hypothetical protein
MVRSLRFIHLSIVIIVFIPVVSAVVTITGRRRWSWLITVKHGSPLYQVPLHIYIFPYPSAFAGFIIPLRLGVIMSAPVFGSVFNRSA